MDNHQTKKIFKKGSTLNAKCRVRPRNNEITSLNGITISSSVKTKNGIYHPVTITIPDANGLMFIARIDDTSDFVEGSALWDFKFILNGSIIYSETEELTIVNNITP